MPQTSTLPAAPPGSAALRPLSPLVIASVTFAMFMAVLDQTIVGTALPAMAHDLGDEHLYTWVVTSYLVTSTVFVPIFGTLSDRYGRKLLLVAGIVLFAVFSALCGIVDSMPQLIAARAFQGVGAAALVTVPLALVLDRSPKEKAVQIQSAFGAVIAGSLLIGPYVGGLLTDQADWRWVFFINVPVAVVVLAVVGLRLERDTSVDPDEKLDLIGFAVFSAGICALLIGLSEKGGESGGVTREWTDPIVLWPVIGGLVALAVFVVVELRVPHPIIPVRRLAAGRFGPTIVGAVMVSVLMYPAIIFVPRYFQAALGTTATDSAVRTLPLMGGLVLGLILLGLVVSATGAFRIPLLVAAATSGAGLWMLWDLDPAQMLPTYLGLGLLGLGIGPMISGLMMVAENSLTQDEVGLATSTVTFFRQIGGAVALAFAGSIYVGSFRDSGQDVAVATSDTLVSLGVVGVIAFALSVLVLPDVTLTHPAPETTEPETTEEPSR